MEAKSAALWDGQLLPPISPSSFLRAADREPAPQFSFRFQVHQASGTLTLVPDDDTGLLKAVGSAVHREPEEHLATAVNLVLDAMRSAGLERGISSVLGLTEKDRSLVDMLARELGGQPSGDILLPDAHSLEAQDVVSRSSMPLRTAGTEGARVVVLRHLLEHARDLDAFLSGLQGGLRAADLCLIEVPDSQGLLVAGDLSQLWEEHTAYFTSESLRAALQSAGFDLIAERTMTSEGEDLCLVIVRRGTAVRPTRAPMRSASAEEFFDRLPAQLMRLRVALKERAEQRKVVVFGANHMAGLFLDLVTDSASQVQCLLDDDPTKWGKVLGLRGTPVCDPAGFEENEPLHVLVAVNQGRSPSLYERLQLLRPEAAGHRVESLVSLYRCCWEEAA